MYVSDNLPGFWGPVTSSVDWCEPNYVHSYYIAETLNTLSSAAMIMIGVLGAGWNYATHWKHIYSFHTISLIGLGSLLFHMTLKYYTQMLDEIPMLWSASMMLITSLETKFLKLPSWCPLVIYSISLLATLATALAQGPLQVTLFRTSFILYLEISLGFGIHRFSQLKAGSPLVEVFKRGFVYYGMASVVWLTDLFKCSLFQEYRIYPFFHALWHIFISIGVYHFMIFSNYFHQTRFGYNGVDVVFSYGFPFLVKSNHKN